MKINYKIINGQLVPYSEADKQKVAKLKEGAIYQFEAKTTDERSIAQNKALHLWGNQIAELLNNNNQPIAKFIKAEVSWSGLTVKEILIKPIMKALFNYNSTTQLKKSGDLDKLIDTITIAFARKGVEIPPFPNKELLKEK